MNSQVFCSSSAALLISAFLLDLAVGDPRWLPHPVVFMGRFISHGETWLRSGSARRDFLAGMALSLFVDRLSVSVNRLGTNSALFALLPRWLSFIATAALGLYDFGNARV